MMILSVDVDYEQYELFSIFEWNGSDRMPALLAALIDAIGPDQATGVLKNQGCELEGHSFVLDVVASILGRVPLILHSVYTDRSTLVVAARL